MIMDEHRFKLRTIVIVPPSIRHQATCSCGWASPTYTESGMASSAHAEHVDECTEEKDP